MAIARALAADVELLLVDEPTARLDEENARLCSVLLARAAHERGLAVVCATHDPVLIEAADTVVQVYSGRVPGSTCRSWTPHDFNRENSSQRSGSHHVCSWTVGSDEARADATPVQTTVN